MQCVHCGRSTGLTEDGARSIGWRIFNGTSFNGDPFTDCLCPSCSGRQTIRPPEWHIPQDSLLDLLPTEEKP